MDDSELHDPDKVNEEENELEEQVEEEITDTEEVRPAEESAVNTDTDTAKEADEESAPAPEEPASKLEKEAELVDAALENKKHKNRESTSEKAKKAAATRKAKGLSEAPLSAKTLDPLRLRGKKYRAQVALVEKGRIYPLEEALELVKQTSYSKFDATVELHAKVKTETVRGTVTLPHGTGKSKKVAVADDETLEAIAAGKLGFDVLLATPAQMPKLARFAKLLGPKGLMPSPKAGTVTEDLEKVKEEISGGRIEYRADKNGVVHASIGRVSFPTEQLVENFKVLVQVLISAKILTLSLSATMGPGVRVEKE